MNLSKSIFPWLPSEQERDEQPAKWFCFPWFSLALGFAITSIQITYGGSDQRDP
jgi:hypothetical protein